MRCILHIYDLSPRSEEIYHRLTPSHNAEYIHQSCHGSYDIIMPCFVIDVHYTSHKHTIRTLANLTKVLMHILPYCSLICFSLPLVSALDLNATIDCDS